MIESLIGLGAVLTLVLLRMPIAFAMGLVGMIGYMLETSYRGAISMVARLIIDTSQDYGLSVVPMFILMGLFVNKGGLSRALYTASNAFLGHFRGGLAMATIVACAGFSAICGSSLATAATMSKVAMPEMRRFGYTDSLSTASIAAGGTLGILIPPSVILVIYGLLTETSIGKLFIAGVVPGLLGVLFYLAAVRYTVWRNPSAGPAGIKMPWPDRLRALGAVWSVLLLFLFVIGGLYGVLNFAPLNLTFSPTEAAGMGAAGAFLIALARGGLTVSSTVEVLKETAVTTAALFSVLIGAWIFSNFVNLAGLPEGLQDLVTRHAVAPWMVILTILLIYVLLGCVFESLSMLLLTVPIFFPLVTGLGYDPVWFGIVVVVVTEISLITPPVGLNVFVLKGVVEDVTTGTIFRGVTPFWIVDILRLLLIVSLPWIALALPNSMT
ncbi:MAG: TRAP transporter large permease [Gammaproteobacteria bacterium]|nr:TRAP transporter large permease [Gammaproteobacteria bacterium]